MRSTGGLGQGTAPYQLWAGGPPLATRGVRGSPFREDPGRKAGGTVLYSSCSKSAWRECLCLFRDLSAKTHVGAPEPTDEVTQQGAPPGGDTQAATKEAKARAEEGGQLETEVCLQGSLPALTKEAVSHQVGKVRKLLPQLQREPPPG